MLNELPGELVADAAGAAGYDGERTKICGVHAGIS
jgi:hypothetical protein